MVRIKQINFVKTSFADKLHQHNKAYEFHYCIQGESGFNYNDRYYPFKPGVLILCRPGTLHQVLKPRQNISFYYVIFTLEDKDLLKRTEEKFSKQAFLMVPQYYHSFFENLRAKSLDSNPDQKKSASYQLLAFLYELQSRQFTHKIPSGEDRINQAIRFMQDHIRENISLQEIAEAAGLEKSYFSRLFKQYRGLSPGKYLNQLKISTASYMLKQGEQSICEIAAYLGFYDEYHFSRVFKQFIGLPPGKYRTYQAQDEWTQI